MIESTNDFPIQRDGRRVALNRETVKLTNEGRVFKAMQATARPMTIAQLNTHVPDIVEKTIRRAIASLVSKGFVVEAGRESGSTLFALVDDSYASGKSGERLIPQGDGVVTVETFLRSMSSTKTNPFGSSLKIETLSTEMTHFLRTRMLYAVVTATDPGFEEQLNKIHDNLQKIEGEMEKVLNFIRKFNLSPIWHPQYRDRFAYELRKVQEEDPELYRLVMDYVKSGS